jgi:hypothetical protein
VQRTDWPVYVRVLNGIEITGSAVVFAGLVVLLLYAPGPWAIIGGDDVPARAAPPPARRT